MHGRATFSRLHEKAECSAGLALTSTSEFSDIEQNVDTLWCFEESEDVMDLSTLPKIEEMTLADAKEYILKNVRPGGDHDFYLEATVRPLLESLEVRRENETRLTSTGFGMTVRHHGGTPYEGIAHHTRVFYDAVWELVREGILRPGPAQFGAMNPRHDGFCLITRP